MPLEVALTLLAVSAPITAAIIRMPAKEKGRPDETTQNLSRLVGEFTAFRTEVYHRFDSMESQLHEIRNARRP